jgi:putative transposase
VFASEAVLALWFQETEGAKFWLQVLSEFKQRGVSDILIGCVDGLKGFPEAIFPQTTSRHASCTSSA